MSDPQPAGTPLTPAEPEVRTARRVSAVWLVPIVAVVAAGWVAWQSLSDLGPKVTIAFETAEGLEAGRTPVKYKDVQVGTVRSIRLDRDLRQVLVEVELSASMDDFVTDRTRFWVVRPRISAGGVSGLGTLFSGAHIALDPSSEGKRTREFQGLEEPPLVTQSDPGTRFTLQAPGLSSLFVGAPVYFREIRVGEVVRYELAKGGDHVDVSIFVRAPYDELVRSNTRFWQAGGVNVSLGAEGVSIESASIVTMLLGGVAFDSPRLLDAGDRAEAGHVFPLFASRRASEEETFSTLKEYYLAYFDESLRGLQRGAPVELQGMQVGLVSDMKVTYNPETLAFRSSVLMEIHPERLGEILGGADDAPGPGIGEMVQKGLRAQLRTGSLLTGARLVNIEMHDDVPPAELGREGDYRVIPSIPSEFEDLSRTLTRILGRLDQVPFDEIGRNVNAMAAGASDVFGSEETRQSLASLASALRELEEVAGQLNEGMMPAVAASLANVERLMANAERMLAPDAPVSVELKRLLRELADAARSVRGLADYLDQHPEALIRGRAEEDR